MPIPWTTEQIIALAPDDQVAKAARSLARPGKWQNLGQSEQAVWGEYQGSGGTPYQVTVDPDGPAFKCSCPSRKRPCKHAVGLLLLILAKPSDLRKAEPPEWVRKWLAGRAAQSAKKTGQPKESIADAKAQTRRAARRAARVKQGAEALSRWIEDLLRRGLGSLQSEPSSFWETQAARLVDAQAPGLARRVREMSAIPASGEGWQSRLLGRLARLHLLLEALRRIDGLPPDLQEEIRGQVGWTQDQAALRQQAGERDLWLVLGRRVKEEDRLCIQRTWLWGMKGKRAALILDFAPLGQSLDSGLVPGSSLDAEVVFWPGSLPQRALVKAQHATHAIETLSGYPNLLAALTAYGTALAHNPWLERFLMPLENIVPIRHGEGWAVRDGQGHFLPLTLPSVEGWRLFALSGGHPLTLVTEWDGESLEPLSAWTGHELIPIGGLQ